MSGVGITYLWVSKEFPPFIRLEGRRGDYEVYTPERTCQRFWTGAEMICSSCAHQLNNGTAKYCTNCGAKVTKSDQDL